MVAPEDGHTLTGSRELPGVDMLSERKDSFRTKRTSTDCPFSMRRFLIESWFAGSSVSCISFGEVDGKKLPGNVASIGMLPAEYNLREGYLAVEPPF